MLTERGISTDHTAASAADFAPPDLVPFRPTPAAAANIFSAIASGRISLFDLAAQHHTTLTDLIVWLESPDTSERHAALNLALAAAVRTASLCHLGTAVPALSRTLNDFAQSPALHEPASRDSSAAQLRYAMLAVRAASLLYRMSRISGETPRKFLPRQGVVRPHAGQAPVISTPLLSSTTDLPLPTSHIAPAAPDFTASPLRPENAESPAAPVPAPTVQDAVPHPDAEPELRNPAAASSSPLTTRDSPLPDLLDSLESLSDEELFAALQRGDIDPVAVLAAAGFSAGPAP